MGFLGDLRFMRERGGEAAAKARFLKGAAAIGLAVAALAATAHLAYAGMAGTRPMCPERCA